MRHILLGLLITGWLAGNLAADPHTPAPQATPTAKSKIEILGKALFFDTSLSSPPGQSCATCHDPKAGWAGPRSDINAHGGVYPGALETRFGNRKPPSAAYATLSPPLHYDAEEELFLGGNFWDGRATGWLLGQPAAEQAQKPFLNPVEQNLDSARPWSTRSATAVTATSSAQYSATRSAATWSTPTTP